MHNHSKKRENTARDDAGRQTHWTMGRGRRKQPNDFKGQTRFGKIQNSRRKE